MSARTGMSELIGLFRNGVADTGTVYFTDDRAQQILDARRLDFWQDPLTPVTAQVAVGSVEYKVYLSRYRYLEGTADASYFRLFDGNGTAITTGFTFDAVNGRFDFTANQVGSARYLDGRSYDLYGAIADGWREMAGLQSGAYDFKVEGRSYTRSQWFAHCTQMAEYFDAKSSGGRGTFGSDAVGTIERGDMTC